MNSTETIDHLVTLGWERSEEPYTVQKWNLLVFAVGDMCSYQVRMSEGEEPKPLFHTRGQFFAPQDVTYIAQEWFQINSKMIDIRGLIDYAGEEKIPGIKALRALYKGLGLKDAKDLWEALNKRTERQRDTVIQKLGEAEKRVAALEEHNAYLIEMYTIAQEFMTSEQRDKLLKIAQEKQNGNR